MTETEQKTKLKFFKTGGKKTKIIVVVILILAILASVIFVNVKRHTAMMKNASTKVSRTEEVKKQSLIKSVGATGTVVSLESKDLTVDLTDIKVQSVNVEVGNTVEEGQMLLSFDTSDIEKELENAQTELETEKKKTALSESDAARAVSDSELTKEYQISSAQTKVDNAYTQYQQAAGNCASEKEKLTSASAAETTANETYTALGNSLQAASETLASTETDYQNAKSAAEANPSDENLALALQQAEVAYQSAQTEYNSLSAQYSEAENAYQSAVSNRQAQEAAVQAAEAQVSSTYADYNEQLKNYDYTEATQESSVAKAKSSQSAAALTEDLSTQEDKVDEYKTKLDEGVLYAPISGVITAVNYEEGETYAGDTLITIQDCSAYEIEAEIDEYDISNIALGQSVLIKTDATGDEEMEGKVIFISPTSTKNSTATGSGTTATNTSSTSSDVNYKIRISIDNPDERLRLDMSASLSIIVEEHEDVLTVPYNAVWTDNDGNSYVSVVDGETTKDVAVDVVMESNYYTEISSDEIKEGEKVEIVEDSNATDNESGVNGMQDGQAPNPGGSKEQRGPGGGPGQGGGF